MSNKREFQIQVVDPLEVRCTHLDDDNVETRSFDKFVAITLAWW